MLLSRKAVPPSFSSLREESWAAWMDAQYAAHAAHAVDPWVLDAGRPRSNPNDVVCRTISLGVLRSGEDAGNRLRVAHPRRGLLLEVCPATRRDLVVARSPTVLRNSPLGRDELAAFEAIQTLIQRTVVDVQRAARAFLEPARDLEPVHGLPRECAEDQQVERPFHQRQRLSHIAPPRVSIQSLEEEWCDRGACVKRWRRN